jgi:hypothetical protein
MYLEEKHSENAGLPKKFIAIPITIGSTMIIYISSLKTKSIVRAQIVARKLAIKVDAIRKTMIALLTIKSPI